YGDSPYQSFSTFAGNPYYIDLEELIKKGWLTEEECEAYDFGGNDRYVDYEKIYRSRFKILKTAYQRSKIGDNKEFQKFKAGNAMWLEDYALYMAVKNSFGGASWIEWDEEIKLRRPEAVKAYKEKFAEEIEFYQFQQFLFAAQWFALKAYANKKKISIIGDIPIYVAFDSADTWANPELFQLDGTCTPVGVAGCPPDSFSATGQLWGNPLY
ncbi:MAG TPA: 4-alpha-glucanotransferase, partial [Lachnospiraceae bacterium]|nr:4-alpha-glucanotransferase [Lachnospiraceae bacterium]